MSSATRSISILVLLGIVADSVALLFGGGPRLLLVRESLITGVFGLACLFSLLLPRPMMLYFARHFIAGTDPARHARFNGAWQFPEVRFCHRLITTVWGCAFVGELVARIVLIYNLPAAPVLVISPILIGVLTISTSMGVCLRAPRAPAGDWRDLSRWSRLRSKFRTRSQTELKNIDRLYRRKNRLYWLYLSFA